MSEHTIHRSDDGRHFWLSCTGSAMAAPGMSATFATLDDPESQDAVHRWAMEAMDEHLRECRFLAVGEPS